MYYIEKENKIVLFDTDKERLENTLLFLPQYQIFSQNEDGEEIYINPEILETDREIVTINNECRFKDEVLEELEQIEKERVARLKMTPRDFLLALVDMGLDFNEVETLINSNPRVKIELNYCNHIYRGNPLLDQLAPQFNITPEQLDELFKQKGE